MGGCDDSQKGGMMDQLSMDDLRLMPATLIAPMTRMSEKLAGIEGRFGAKIEALGDDTAKIRQAMHDMANAQQVTIGVERQFAMQLAAISEQLKSHSDQVANNGNANKEKMSALKAQIADLMSKVEALTIARHHIEGAWWTILKVAAVLVGLSAILWPTVQHWRFVP